MVLPELVPMNLSWYEELRTAGVRVLHDDPLPFPLGNWRAHFVAGFRRCLAQCKEPSRSRSV